MKQIISIIILMTFMTACSQDKEGSEVDLLDFTPKAEDKTVIQKRLLVMTPSLPEHFPKDFMIEPSLKLMDIQSTDEGERFFFESSLNQSDLVLFYSNEMLKNHWTSQPLIGKGLLKQYIYQKEGRSIGLTFIPLTTGVQVEMIYQAVAVEESL